MRWLYLVTTTYTRETYATKKEAFVAVAALMAMGKIVTINQYRAQKEAQS